MADGITITPGTGPTVGTDEVSGLTPTLVGVSHVQYLKLVDGTPDSVNKLKVEADGALREVGDAAAASTTTSITSTTTPTSLVAANSSRRGLYIYNNSTSDLYVKYGSGVTTSLFTVRIPPSGYWEMPNRPIFSGLLTGVWASVNGQAQVTEL